VFIANFYFCQTEVDFHSTFCHRLVLAAENGLLCTLQVKTLDRKPMISITMVALMTASRVMKLTRTVSDASRLVNS
jgi:hypothetical protein